MISVELLKQVNDDVLKSLKEVEKKYNLKFNIQKTKYSDTEALIRLHFILTDEESEKALEDKISKMSINELMGLLKFL